MTTMIQMPVTAWIAVPDNPRQRNTEARATRSRHLYKVSRDHTVVAAARLPDGKLVKIDGHTRALMWDRGEIERPDNVQVVLYDVASLEEAKEIYTHYDSPEAVEKSADRIFGSLREAGIVAESELIKSGKITNAMNMARKYAGVRGSVYEATRYFAASVCFLDSLNLRHGMFPTGVVGALLLTHHKYGSRAEKFWTAVAADRGFKMNGIMDGVQATREIIAFSKGMYGGAQNEKVLRRTVNAFEKWLVGENLHQVPRAVNMQGYMKAA